MKIASWNVNSLKVRLAQVLDWLQTVEPDVLALQETKLTDDKFPLEEINKAGYEVVFSGQKTYNGVAILSRHPIEQAITDIAELDDPQRRILEVSTGGIRVLNLYVVNGQAVDSDKYQYKLDWLAKVRAHIAATISTYDQYVVLGDFNIAPDDRDVHDPSTWHEKILCSTPEREALRAILDLGLQDTFRLFEQPDATFSWWDYRAAGFRRNRGLRIDLILASTALSGACEKSYIDVEPRKLERPSDHAPAVAEFAQP